MRSLDGERLAAMAGLEVMAAGPDGGPERATIDSREARAGDLFFGLPGERADGGQFAGEVLERGAWGIVAGTVWANELAAHRSRSGADGGWILAAADPLGALQCLARERRRELGCDVVGITGSTGKTSVKDACRALLPARTHASPENYNTEIGMPLAILAAPEDSEVLVLEMGMRGVGQIAELCEIAAPDVGVVTNVGPVHVQLLGSLAAVASTKAEILAGIAPHGAAVVPAEAGPLEPHLSGEAEPRPPQGAQVLRFGEGGDVEASDVRVGEKSMTATVTTPDGEQPFEFPFTEAHNLENALAAIAAGVALGMPLLRMAQRAAGIVFSRLRGEVIQLAGDAILINDCYNANPVSMRAALDHLASLEVPGRRLAVLGEMRELGDDAAAYHREAGEHARETGVEYVIGVGELGAEYGPDEH